MKDESRKNVAATFNANPELKSAFSASNGCCFLEEIDCKSYANGLTDKSVEEVNRKDFKKEIDALLAVETVTEVLEETKVEKTKK